MQEVGNVQSGACCARVQNTVSREQSDDDQVRHGPGGTSDRVPARAKVASSPDIKPDGTSKFLEKPDEDSSSEKLKDALLVSFIDWFSGHLTTGSYTPEISAASEGKLAKSMSREADSAQSVGRMAREITSNHHTSLLIQANVAQDTALHLLSVGALAEAVQEPDQKQHTLFDADYMDVRTKVAKMPHGPI